jgi:FAD/FMN-containing dehydrogenase
VISYSSQTNRLLNSIRERAGKTTPKVSLPAEEGYVRAVQRELSPDANEQVAGAYGGNAARLRAAKAEFDPNNVFSSALMLAM